MSKIHRKIIATMNGGEEMETLQDLKEELKELEKRIDAKLEEEFEKENRKVEREIEDWASPFEFEVGERNYYFYYNHDFDEVDISYDVARQHIGLYFSSKEDAENCLQAVGEERVKKYYLEVE